MRRATHARDAHLRRNRRAGKAACKARVAMSSLRPLVAPFWNFFFAETESTSAARRRARMRRAIAAAILLFPTPVTCSLVLPLKPLYIYIIRARRAVRGHGDDTRLSGATRHRSGRWAHLRKRALKYFSLPFSTLSNDCFHDDILSFHYYDVGILPLPVTTAPISTCSSADRHRRFT